ncbi:MAG: 1-deoxy-D-xylulose-5-phosphate synthase N-terminal domain-containing protein [Pseudomonadota bacterium]|nr:1-deoxy-D-xylulose-5-phosphate synthase N-terminal domain-containing protein [Pseudomonadota bacterium]
MHNIPFDPDDEGPLPLRDSDRLAYLRVLEQKILWLSTWIIHHANHVRPSDGHLKVGGHQASCASMVTLMTALYFSVLRPEDRVAVKPHGSPVFHAIQYVLGQQSQGNLERFRSLGGAQSYPSRTKDADDVDFSTGSVGLGVAMTSFASLIQTFIETHSWKIQKGRMIAVVGDAELDEGNIYEALLEGWKHNLENVWWIIDYNRQSLDSVISDRLLSRFTRLFNSMGWKVSTIKYGKRLQDAFDRKGGDALRQWIDACPNSKYSALVYKGPSAWRQPLLDDIGSRAGVASLIGEYNDSELFALMTNLGGHCIETVLDAFEAVEDEQPTCFFAYTIKGYGLPLAGHKDNHAGLLNVEQIAKLKEEHNVPDGQEWSRFAGIELPTDGLEEFISNVPFRMAGRPRRYQSPVIPVPAQIDIPTAEQLSTQEAFGRMLNNIARTSDSLADRIITMSPDVTVSTNLSGWVNRRGLFHPKIQNDLFLEEEVGSLHRWPPSPTGQHFELGIAENNLFLLLAAAGLSHSLFGHRLLPIGTIYDPFIERGLDALNYACYQDARFILVATPSGISLSPEGGAHQSIGTPLIGISKPGLSSFEPTYADELAAILRWSFIHLQCEDADESDHDLLNDHRGGSVYLRLTTHRIAQLQRQIDPDVEAGIIEGGYWLRPPAPGARLSIAYVGVVGHEALSAHTEIVEQFPGAGLLAVTSPDRLHRGWLAAQSQRQTTENSPKAAIERLLAPLNSLSQIITVVDGHPSILSWIGSVHGHPVRALGVERYGESGSLSELYEAFSLNSDSIVKACNEIHQASSKASTER